MPNKTSLQRKWQSWALPTKVAFIASLFAITSALPLYASYESIRNFVVGAPPLDLPLKSQLAGALQEMDENVNCLSTYNTLRTADVDWNLCRPKKRYMHSLYMQFSVLSSNDRYGESENIYEDWAAVLTAYRGLLDVDDKAEFLHFEKTSPRTLRDVLFLTTFFRFYYEKYYESAPDCPVDIETTSENGTIFKLDSSNPECLKVWKSLEEERKYSKLISKWDDWPANRTKVDGKLVVEMSDWLSLID